MSIVRNAFFILLCLVSVQVWGQAARSPFTSFGIGEPYGAALANTQGTAGVGVSQPQFWHLNNQNPALLVYNTFTVFQAGIVAETRTLRSDTASEKNVGGNMNYLVTAFPIKPTRWTTSLGLMPYTTVKYKLSYLDNIINSTDQVNVTEEGLGGFTQLYWSNGVRIYKDLAIGLKASYVFSSIEYSTKNQLVTSSQPINYVAEIQEKSYVKDFIFALGVSYSKDSLFAQQKYRLSFGGVVNFGADLKTRQRHLLSTKNSVDDVYSSDTLAAATGNIHIPPSFTAGISLSHTKGWMVGTEFSYQNWSTFKNINRTHEGLGTSWRAALGGEIIPDGFSESYLKRITYRAGVSMEQYPFLANNTSVQDLGINFGFSLPAGRSSLDFAFKYGKRGNKSENILEENYFKIYFGITFNDQWFIKRKFD